MPEITVKVVDRTPELMMKLDLAVGRFVRKGVAYIGGQVKTSMAEPKSGRTYRRGKSGVHVASAPGQSPAIDSSNLVGSIQEIFPSTLEGKAGTNVEYAGYLEDGTDRMDARPVWEKTAEESLPTLERMLRAEVHGV